MKVNIFYHHTDAGGVVYYGRYLSFLEEARTEFLAQRGLSVKDLIQEGTLFVVARQEIDYKLPVFYADTLTINARLVNTSAVKLEFEYDIKNQRDQVTTKAKTILVCVDKNLKPKAIPEEIRKKIT
jgi:acyl-CoA thioester hydrolase